MLVLPRAGALALCLVVACESSNFARPAHDSGTTPIPDAEDSKPGPDVDDAGDADGSIDAASARDSQMAEPEASDADGDSPTPSTDAGDFEINARFSQPLSDYVRGRVTLQVASESSTAERVLLYLNGQLIATLGLPFEHVWDSDQVPEGAHRFSATVFAAGAQIGSVQRELTVDRTPPRLVDLGQEQGLSELDSERPLQLRFSEPVQLEDLRSSLSDAPVTLRETADPARYELMLKLQQLPASFTLRVAGSVHDLSGLPLGADVSHQVTVPAWRGVLPVPAGTFAISAWGATLWVGLGPSSSGGLGLARLNADKTFSAAPLRLAISSQVQPSHALFAHPGGAILADNSSPFTIDGIACDAALVCRALPTFAGTLVGPIVEYKLLGAGVLWFRDPLTGNTGASDGGAWFDPMVEFRAGHAGGSPESVDRSPHGDLFVYTTAASARVVIQKKSGGYEEVATDPPAGAELHQTESGQIFAVAPGYPYSPTTLYLYEPGKGFTAVPGISGKPLRWISDGTTNAVVSPAGAFDLTGKRIAGPLPASLDETFSATVWAGKPAILAGGKLAVMNVLP